MVAVAKVRRVNKSSAILNKYFLTLILLIVIVNVQIVGLNYAKPRLWGPPKWAGYKKEKECKSDNFELLNLERQSKHRKNDKSTRKRIRKVIRNVERVERLERDRPTNGKDQISFFWKIAHKTCSSLTVIKIGIFKVAYAVNFC